MVEVITVCRRQIKHGLSLQIFLSHKDHFCHTATHRNEQYIVLTDKPFLPFVKKWARTHGVHRSLNCPILTGNQTDACQDLHQYLHLLMVVRNMTIVQAKVFPAMKKCGMPIPTEETTLSYDMGWPTVNMEFYNSKPSPGSEYLPFSSRIISSTVTLIW